MNKILNQIKNDFSRDVYLKGLFWGICLTGLTTYVSVKKTKTRIAVNDLGGIYWFSQQDPYLYNYVLDEKKKEYSLWNILITYEEDGVLIKKILSHKTPLGDLAISLMLTGIWPISWRVLNVLSGAAAVSVVSILK